MMSLQTYAIREFEVMGWLKNGEYCDEMQEAVCKNILEMLGVFSKEGHSGFSANYTLNLFEKLARFKPIKPLTFEDDEWAETEGQLYQNKRNSAVFKNDIDGKPYFIDAHIQRCENGSCWGGSLTTPKGTLRKCYIKDPANLPTIYIHIIDWEVNKDDESISEPGSGWWVHKMTNPAQLKELEKYYELEFDPC